MLDYRYHAISLIAVLIALTLGLLLGLTIGDAGLVSNFKGDIRESLSSDLKSAREARDAAQGELERSERFLSEAFPQIVSGQLRGQRVALIGNAGATRDALAEVRETVEAADGKLVFAGEIKATPPVEEIAGEMGIAVPEEAAQQDAGYAERVGKAAGRRIGRGRASRDLRQLVFGRFSGQFGRTRSDVYVRVPQDNDDASELEISEAFERGVIKGLVAARRRVVGVENSDADPSQIRFYKSLGLSTVDNLNTYAGRYALVQVLDGATGDYGYKKSADAVIPPVAQ